MSVYESVKYREILDVILKWPPDKRFALVQDVLVTLAPGETGQARRKTAEKALGLLATDQSAPSDGEIKQWLHERRMDKYG
ncbi:MAG: hypothetical protein JXA89_12560 [Anaerolineae bacterium]|nr:hypothetical protein [Anaerolineae bacterium]